MTYSMLQALEFPIKVLNSDGGFAVCLVRVGHGSQAQLPRVSVPLCAGGSRRGSSGEEGSSEPPEPPPAQLGLWNWALLLQHHGLVLRGSLASRSVRAPWRRVLCPISFGRSRPCGRYRVSGERGPLTGGRSAGTAGGTGTGTGAPTAALVRPAPQRGCEGGAGPGGAAWARPAGSEGPGGEGARNLRVGGAAGEGAGGDPAGWETGAKTALPPAGQRRPCLCSGAVSCLSPCRDELGWLGRSHPASPCRDLPWSVPSARACAEGSACSLNLTLQSRRQELCTVFLEENIPSSFTISLMFQNHSGSNLCSADTKEANTEY
ncbi:paraneoplastic antigen Ma6E-like [Manacus candei]|uniref:paraneoplastic antigen Ma6E-like n=1 Tax=Manacus candei TaxID=415023 RepID=UPI00222607FB|nr:paraneoplastic antigen Ma6E-like [Manacus candei]